MKFTQKENKDSTLLLEITLEPKDYEGKVQEKIQEYRKNAVIPGFRKGKAPIAFLIKKYRTPILIDEVNKLMQKEIYDFLKKDSAKFLGSPIPIEDNDIDWENEKIFNFTYEIGISPEFDIKITNKDNLTYYSIEADKSLVEKYCDDIAKRHGEMTNPEQSKEGDLLFCSIQQLDITGSVLDNGISNEATVSIKSIEDKKARKSLIGISKGACFKLDVVKCFSNQTDLAAMLNIKQNEVSKLKYKEFNFTVKNINRLSPCKLNQDLFDKVYGKDVVKNVAEFKRKIKEEAEKSFTFESDKMLKNDIVDYLLNKIKLTLPDRFLKKWLIKTSETSLTEEKVKDEYEMYSKSLKWQLIEGKVIQNFNIEIKEEDMLSKTKELVQMQMKQYGQVSPEEKHLDDIAKNILNNEKEREKIHHQILDEKTLEIYKENFKITNKKISYDDFIKLATEKK
tara:strand:- start:778 stop:2133 length:1356 start_codon:yes stop_codon:yes gene_type:complete